VIRRLKPAVAAVDGITLYMQPVQDITVEDIVSRTEYQYSMEDPDPDELSRYAGSFVQRLNALPELADVASDLQNHGMLTTLTFDRSTAMRPHQPHGPVSRRRRSRSTSRPAPRWARPSRHQRVEKELPKPAAMQASFQGTAQAFQAP
jgi:hypothetical protein